MKYFVISLCLTICCTPELKTAHAEPTNRSALVTPVKKAQLQLATTVVKQTSCFSGHLSLGLRFTFKNVGGEPVILSKQSFIVRSRVSRSLNAAMAKKYEQESRADMFADSFPVNPTDMSDFVVVRPGESYDLQTDQTRVSLYVQDNTRGSKDDLRPGSYFLQIEVATWTYLGDAAEFREKWKSNGLLWSEGLTSQPMPFAVEQNRPIVKCS
ncbi:MAG TPA: hypothetical protein VGJ37_08850 [Pyrinomonadaceae bacterium]|jgi:hypothetical protein